MHHILMLCYLVASKIFPEWTESVHVVLSTLIAVPVQGFFIWRCHYILKKNLYCTIPLVLASIGSVVTAILVSLYAFRHGSIRPADGKGYHPSAGRIWCPFLAFLLIPTILDIAITIIMLRYLTSSLKNVHTDHLRRRISRFIIVVWQAAIPPCICTILLLIKYLVFTTSHPVSVPRPP
ncbi:hypothetical protein BC834DRAFT_119178 [Gloeopeniophorella convolvens]|nr:hypothetical protein BC834DRAFT_119178 [Gloeopeniophorella convolvens]